MAPAFLCEEKVLFEIHLEGAVGLCLCSVFMTVQLTELVKKDR